MTLASQRSPVGGLRVRTGRSSSLPSLQYSGQFITSASFPETCNPCTRENQKGRQWICRDEQKKAAMGLEADWTQKEAPINISAPSSATWPCARLLRKNTPHSAFLLEKLQRRQQVRGWVNWKGINVAIMGKDLCSNGLPCHGITGYLNLHDSKKLSQNLTITSGTE